MPRADMKGICQCTYPVEIEVPSRAQPAIENPSQAFANRAPTTFTCRPSYSFKNNLYGGMGCFSVFGPSMRISMDSEPVFSK